MSRRVSAALGVVLAVSLLGTGSAFAHADLESTGPASTDGLAPVELTVPNERSSTGTVKIELVLPPDPAIPVASVIPAAGWTGGVTEVDGRVERITWTGGPVTGDASATFSFLLGPVPVGVSEMQLSVLQTYDDGEIVRWIDAPTAGGPEPDHPAPVLTLAPGAAIGQPTTPEPSSTTSTSATAPVEEEEQATERSRGGGSSARTVIGAVIVVVALTLVGGVAVRGHRRAAKEQQDAESAS
jgi:uncharacterized protein